jgi:hypothetical protein
MYASIVEFLSFIALALPCIHSYLRFCRDHIYDPNNEQKDKKKI